MKATRVMTKGARSSAHADRKAELARHLAVIAEKSDEEFEQWWQKRLSKLEPDEAVATEWPPRVVALVAGCGISTARYWYTSGKLRGRRNGMHGRIMISALSVKEFLRGEI